MNKATISVSTDMYNLLKVLKIDESKTLDELADLMNIPRAKIELLTFRLLDKDLVKREVTIVTRAIVSDKGKEILANGLPENQLIVLLSKNKDGFPFSKIATELNLSKQEVNAGIGQLKRAKLIDIKKGIVYLIKKQEKLNLEIEDAIQALSKNPLASISRLAHHITS